jgi:hypothetical protein
MIVKSPPLEAGSPSCRIDCDEASLAGATGLKKGLPAFQRVATFPAAKPILVGHGDSAARVFPGPNLSAHSGTSPCWRQGWSLDDGERKIGQDEPIFLWLRAVFEQQPDADHCRKRTIEHEPEGTEPFVALRFKATTREYAAIFELDFESPI